MSELRRLTARSVVLSVLLGAHPACASAAELVSLTADFGIQESALRVALTRMVGAGDLVRSADGYRLSDRLLARQRRQDQALEPARKRWDQAWVTVLVTSVGEDARTRAEFRKTLQDCRFAELREGVWLRPNNLDRELPASVLARTRVLLSKDGYPQELTRLLWDLVDWAEHARKLLYDLASTDISADRFMIAAAMVRHLLADPILPPELLPADWPADELRAAYGQFAAELGARRGNAGQPMEVASR